MQRRRLRWRGAGLQPAERGRRGQGLSAAHGRLHHQIAAQHVVVAHVRPAQAQAVDALRQQAVHAVLDAGAAAPITERKRRCAAQAQPFIDLLEQQHATVADDVATVECGLDNTSANAAKLNSLIGTLWHRRSSVFIGVRYL